jgi:ADP-heptose:LPS heptosyltransferase
VARDLGEHHELPTVVTWAGSSELAIARQVVAKAGGHACLAPATSLPELAALLRRTKLMIASDTGPLHLAAAVGTPCLGLYGPTRAARSGPYGPQHYTIEVEAAPIRNRRRRRQDDSAMRQISVESVCEACHDMLSQPQTDTSSSSQSHAA